MKKIYVDKEGYNQFFNELENLKKTLLSNATSGSEAYKAAVGDGWHDNFAFEESMRVEREISFKINMMLEEKKCLEIVEVGNYDDEIIDINDIITMRVKYSEDDIEEYTLKLTGKYLPNSDELSLNSPLGKVIYLKNINDKLFYTVNDKKIEIIILEKKGFAKK